MPPTLTFVSEFCTKCIHLPLPSPRTGLAYRNHAFAHAPECTDTPIPVERSGHPNVYDTGEVCISILHAPGNDEYGYENAGERWLPIHTGKP